MRLLRQLIFGVVPLIKWCIKNNFNKFDFSEMNEG